jgi:transposase
VRVYLFVATLGYSRRLFVQAFRHERQSAWLDGIEALGQLVRQAGLA